MIPKIFIGSSTEHLDVAQELATLLAPVADILPWDKIVRTGQYTLEALIEASGRCDFALFVFAPDDILYSRNREYWATRDNVIFELGLFMTRLGRERAFLVVPQVDGHKMLTDLLGLTYVSYIPEGDGRAESLRKCAERLSDSIRANPEVSHTGWNDLLWLKSQLSLHTVNDDRNALDVVRSCAKRPQQWRDGDFEDLMKSVQNTYGVAAANTVHFVLFWCGVVIPSKALQPYWYDGKGNRWQQYVGYVRLSDRGLVLLNHLR